MNSFKDLGIKVNLASFVGDKVPVKKLINQSITVIDYKIEPSKKKENTQLLTLQIEKSGDKRIVFTGSKVLIDQINRVPKEKFPFATVISDENDYYEFT